MRAIPTSAKTGQRQLCRWPALVVACLISLPVDAQAAPGGNVIVSKTIDISFGSIAALTTDQRRSISLCVGRNGSSTAYSVQASGSGVGGSFALSNGSYSVPIEVQWSPSVSQTSGTSLSPLIYSSGFTSTENQTCSTANTSLIVILRSIELQKAKAGNYSGSLSLTVRAD